MATPKSLSAGPMTIAAVLVTALGADPVAVPHDPAIDARDSPMPSVISTPPVLASSGATENTPRYGYAATCASSAARAAKSERPVTAGRSLPQHNFRGCP